MEKIQQNIKGKYTKKLESKFSHGKLCDAMNDKMLMVATANTAACCDFIKPDKLNFLLFAELRNYLNKELLLNKIIFPHRK